MLKCVHGSLVWIADITVCDFILRGLSFSELSYHKFASPSVPHLHYLESGILKAQHINFHILSYEMAV